MAGVFDLDEVADLPPILLLAVNVIPLVGVVWLGWDVRSVLTLYWAENLIIGASTIVKMIASSPIGGIFGGAFFLVHYGGFCAVHGLFILALTGDPTNDLMQLGESWPFVFVFVELLVKVTGAVFATAPKWWFVAFGALVISHGLSLVTNFFVRGERKSANVQSLMGSPYGRVILLHVTIIGGGFAVLALGSPVWLLVILVVIKTLVDLGFHLREHRKAQAAGSPVTAPGS